MATRLITARKAMLKHCHAAIVLANLITAIFTLPAQLVHISVGYWPLGMPMCIFTITVNSLAFVAVMWLVMVLLIDRVLKSNFHRVYLTFEKNHLRVFHVVIWVILLLLSLPLFVAEFVKQSPTLGDTAARFHCHVPFHATSALFLIVFGFASPITITGIMMTFLWFNIIKDKLMRRRQISAAKGCKYVTKCDSRAMTPWGSNWLNSIENRVSQGPNNALPALRRHSIGKCEPETNRNISSYTGKDRRNSVPEESSESHSTLRECQYYSSQENSWSKITLAIRNDKPSFCNTQAEKGVSITDIGKTKSVRQHNHTCESKTLREKTSHNTVPSDLTPSCHSRIHEGQVRWAGASYSCSKQIKDDLSLPGSVQTDQPGQETVGTKSDKNSETSSAPVQTCKPDEQTTETNSDKGNQTQASSVARLQTQCTSGHRESLSEYHYKHNRWVKGSGKEDNLYTGCDDPNDDDFDDGDEQVRVCKVFTVMVILNLILWLPMICTYSHQSLCDTCEVNLTVWITVNILGQITLVTNPVCLLLVHKHWRPLLKYVLSGFGSFSCLQR